MASQIITFGNDIFSYNKQEPIMNNKEEPMSNKEMEQQNQQNYPYGKMKSDDNIQRDMRAMQSPTVKNNQPPQFNKMFPEQNINYQMNNNNQNIVRGKMINRAQYPPNMGMNRQLPNNQPINQQQYPQSKQIKIPIKQPMMNQLGNKPNINMNLKQMEPLYTHRPGQLNIVQRQPNLSPSPRIISPNLYAKETVPKINNINPIGQKKIMVMPNQDPRTPTKRLANFNGGGAGQNLIKVVRPKMFIDNPPRLIQRTNSYNNFNIISNQPYGMRNPAQNTPNQKIQFNQQPNTTNKKNDRNLIQQPIAKKLVYQMTPQKMPLGQNMNNLRAPGHYVYTQNNVS